MKDARILPLLGPAAVLYLVADVASVAGGLSFVGAAVAAVATFASLAPLMVRRRAEDGGARRVGILGVASGVALVGAVRPDVMSLGVDVVVSLSVAASAALLLDLAATVPDRPRALDRGGLLRSGPVALAVVAGAMGVASALPAWSLFDVAVLAPAWWWEVPPALAIAALLVSVVLRGARRRMGSAPEALASNTWALAGLVPAAAAGVGAATAVTAGLLDPTSPWVRGLLAFAVASMVIGHVAMVDSTRRLAAGRATRGLAASALTLVALGAGVALSREHIPREPVTLALAVIATALVAVGFLRLVSPWVQRLLAPWGGRLLDAVEEAEERLSKVTSLSDVARAVLGPLRRASRSVDAEIFLHTIAPDREATIDAAGEPHVASRPMPEPIARRLADRPGEIIVRAALERLVVRRPELRELVELLVDVDALCVIPLVLEGEVEGALVVPRGRRRSSLSLEEIAACERLGSRLAGLVALLGAQARAQARAGAADLTRKDLEERLEGLGEEVRRLRAEARALQAGRAADRVTDAPIAYSPAMRALTARIEGVAPMDAPVLLLADPGSAVDRVAHMLHHRSGRADGAFVIADCGSLRPERTAAALFGEEGGGFRPGWLRLAEGGTLLLVDVPALSLEAQRDLAEALGSRQARAVDGAGAHPVDVRVIATSRLPLEPLAEAGTFDPELMRWLSALRLDVPPLRDRSEDLESLILLALDRACRVLGREVRGIEPDALAILLAHDWPGNLRELQWVVDRAVVAATGTNVRAADLPPLARAAEEARRGDPLDGTWTELEQRILVHALERAGGNKSEAARLLGLKRTTFLDKLRRHRLSEVEGVSSLP